MDAHLTIDNQKGFMYQGRFSAILETEPLREKIAAHLKTVRGEKDEEAYDMLCMKRRPIPVCVIKFAETVPFFARGIFCI